MQVVPEFGQGSKCFGCCCDAGLDVIVHLEAVRCKGSKVFEVKYYIVYICMKQFFPS
jgi:hypothetical protein